MRVICVNPEKDETFERTLRDEKSCGIATWRLLISENYHFLTMNIKVFGCISSAKEPAPSAGTKTYRQISICEVHFGKYAGKIDALRI